MPRSKQSDTVGTTPLRNWIQQHRSFWIGYGTFLLLGLVALGTREQGYWIWWFNERRSETLNVLFSLLTKLGEEWAFVLVALRLSLQRFRWALSIGVLALLATLVTAIAKNLFRHPRPLAFFRQAGLDDQLVLIEGIHVNASQMSSFPSGHAMAGFALFTFLAFFGSPKNRLWIDLLCLTLAVGVGLSRIYLIQHFLKDVLLGSFWGVLIAAFVYRMQGLPHRGKSDSWLDRCFLPVKR